MDLFLLPETWIALATLVFLEIVLGVDNIIFISIISNKLPEEKRPQARSIGLAMALIFRIGLLLGINYLIGFTRPLVTIWNFELSGRDIILLLGGVFLIYKSTMEIHDKMEGIEHSQGGQVKTASVFKVIIQIILIDMVFSFDSILTAVGLTEHLILMIIAVVISIGVMMAFAGQISEFISKHPTLEVLALSFLILIGFMLMVEAFHHHVPKGYIYFAVFFSMIVELVNMRVRKKSTPVVLRKRITE